LPHFPLRRKEGMAQNTSPIDARVRIGHVHLKVANLERALKFYQGVLGFELTRRLGGGRRFFPPATIIITMA
jgi:catechol-2,3-dioxygenase